MLVLNWKAYDQTFIASLTIDLSISAATLINLDTQNSNGVGINARSVEIINTTSASPLNANIAGRSIVIPPYGYGIFRIPEAALYFSAIGYPSQTVFNFYSYDQPEKLVSFPRTDQQITTADYLEQSVGFTKFAANQPNGALAGVVYHTFSFPFGQVSQPFINPSPIIAADTPIKIANADPKRVKTILGNTWNDALINMRCYYGFSSTTCVIPFNSGRFLVNNPMASAEYWIKFVSAGNTLAAGSTVAYGKLQKEFYGTS